MRHELKSSKTFIAEIPISSHSKLFHRLEEQAYSRMQLLFSSIMILIASACILAEADNNKEENFQAGSPQPSYDVNPKVEGRFIFKTVTLSLQTKTVTTVSTSVTTCTTSTAALSVCTASGRRRRGLHLSGNKEGRGLFYNDEKEEQNEQGSIFLPQLKEKIEPVQSEVDMRIREVRASSEPIPYVVQPGFNAPAGQGRLLFVFGTTTITTTSTTVSIASLTATCRSTTGYQVCNAFGK